MTTPLVRAAQILEAFRDMRTGQMIAAIALESSTARLTYGDLRSIVDELTRAQEQLGRLADWHKRETGEHGTVGSYCVECGHRWPCDTRRMAEGTYVDDEPRPDGRA